MTDQAKFDEFRAVTGLVRPAGAHGCKPVEVVPGVWTARFDDVSDVEKLKSVAPEATAVVNTAAEKCATRPGSYGEGIEVLRVEGVLDSPEVQKKIDEMPVGPDKSAAMAALPEIPEEQRAGDASKHFDAVNALIKAKRDAGGATIVHCHASISRSVVFILAFIMQDQKVSAKEAAKIMKAKWDATWPCDDFVKQLLQYEKHCQA